jgi:hypothetical protein
MTIKEQVKHMLKRMGSPKEALKEHQKIMKGISDIYPSVEDCKKNSLSYSHLLAVEKELIKKEKDYGMDKRRR